MTDRERPFSCGHPGCSKTYTNSSHLKRHQESHNNFSKGYRCSECHLVISNKSNLKRHYNRVHGEKNKITCEKCNKSFHKRFQLFNHIATDCETQPLRLECDKCGKKFSTILCLQRHKNNHKITKQYHCKERDCTKIFDKWTSLRHHMKVEHIEEYICNDCGKLFSCKYKLINHCQTHLDNRPRFRCPIENCERFYYFKRNLSHHIRNYHQGKKEVCNICLMKLCTKQKLTEHIKIYHKAVRNIKRPIGKQKNNKIRKDAGVSKKSIISCMIGLNLSYTAEQALIQRNSENRNEPNKNYICDMYSK